MSRKLVILFLRDFENKMMGVVLGGGSSYHPPKISFQLFGEVSHHLKYFFIGRYI